MRRHALQMVEITIDTFVMTMDADDAGPHSNRWVDEVKNAISVSLSCAAIAVLTSGCIKPVAKTDVSSAVSVGSAASVEAGYTKRSYSGGQVQAATPTAITPRLIPAVARPEVENIRYLGNAPHICSPSGFGRMSTCFSRS